MVDTKTLLGRGQQLVTGNVSGKRHSVPVSVPRAGNGRRNRTGRLTLSGEEYYEDGEFP